MKPLAKSLGIKINDTIDRDDEDGVAEVVTTIKEVGNVLICWEHDQLKDIAKAIGVKGYAQNSGWHGKVEYPDDRFDIIWVVPPPWKEIVEVLSEGVPGLDDAHIGK
jgi:hypothetical protein